MTTTKAGTKICVSDHRTKLLSIAVVNRDSTTEEIEEQAKRDGYTVVAWNVEES